MKNASLVGAPAYAPAPKVRRAIATCAKAGIQIVAVEFCPDGTFRIIAGSQGVTPPANDFDRLDAQGAL